MIAVMLALAVAGADGPPTAPDPVRAVEATSLPITTPEWLYRPSGADMARLLPPAAVREGVSGGARISCTVKADGRLTACTVLEETPPGFGYGKAAIRLSTYFRMKSLDRNGKPVAGGTVVIPLRWNLPPAG